MEFIEAYKKMLESKIRIRRKAWAEGVYWEMDKHGIIRQRVDAKDWQDEHTEVLLSYTNMQEIDGRRKDWEIVQDLTFGQAIEKAKEGCLIARRGWNGKGMAVAYRNGYEDIPCNRPHAEAWGIPVGESIKVRPYLQMRCADGYYQMWTASQTDILAEDWFIVAFKPGGFEF